MRRRSSTRSELFASVWLLSFPSHLRAVPRSYPSVAQKTLSVSLPPPTLGELLERMSPVQLAFFDVLDKELAKIERFFLAREAEARERSGQLRGQLYELQGHRRAFHEAQDHARFPTALRAPQRVRRALLRRPPVRTRTATPVDDEKHTVTSEKPKEKPGPRKVYNPEEYHHARKTLKRAVLEHYRGLEVLNNYRVRTPGFLFRPCFSSRGADAAVLGHFGVRS
ncbi:hypothetical protein FA95DRAFT_59195 [Auriscalpium vulgare]|uniref:Uncharacterized protein n=1 Tax=Auriscalpium vulgare TaxID=40419 RepID=A0ACB8S7Q2_9AGAM|nr:hypothetical protein FA95DRAFT_59195 [Auriscalpium vulgare]